MAGDFARSTSERVFIVISIRVIDKTTLVRYNYAVFLLLISNTTIFAIAVLRI